MTEPLEHPECPLCVSIAEDRARESQRPSGCAVCGHAEWDHFTDGRGCNRSMLRYGPGAWRQACECTEWVPTSTLADERAVTVHDHAPGPETQGEAK